MSYAAITKDLQVQANASKAAGLARFFKTGPGQYGEGDKFLGITVPQQRAVAKHYRNLDLADIERLLHSDIHEYRLTALIILVDQFRRADKSGQQKIFKFYLANTRWINNWDLVDSSAEYIVGPLLNGQDDPLLDRLATSNSLWERRIAMLATFHFIKLGQPDAAIQVAEILENDSHDLIQKAVGWMMREVGKRCGQQILEQWLQRGDRYKSLPRTALRYAIEHFELEKRRAYLRGEV